MKKALVYLVLSVLVFVCISFIYKFYESVEAISYSESEMQKIAWDGLVEKDKKIVLKAANNDQNEVWKNSKVERAYWKDIGTLYVLNNNPIKDVWLWYKRDDVAVRVTFSTQFDGFLGPIGVYIDPETKKVLGFDLLM